MVFDKSGRLVDGYSGFAVTGRCGRIDLARSAIELQEYPSGYGPVFVGHYFDESS